MVLKSGFGGVGAVSLATLTAQEVPVGGGMTLPLWVVETAALALLAGGLMASERIRRARTTACARLVMAEAAAPEAP